MKNLAFNPSKFLPHTYPSVEVEEGRLFLYPNHLSSTWESKIVETIIPSFVIPEFKFEELTRLTTSRPPMKLNPLRRLVTPRHRIKLKGLILDTRYQNDGNLWHILATTASYSVLMRSLYGDLTVVLREPPKALDLKVYDLLEVPYIATNQVVEGDIRMPTHLVACNYVEEARSNFYVNLWKSFDFSQLKKATSNLKVTRCFICRKGDRALINQTQVLDYLKKLGFVAYFFEDLSMRDQWEIGRHAEYVVSTHGAALVNFSFNQSRLRLLEIFHPGYVVNCFQQMTAVLGGKWCGVLGKMPKDLIHKLEHGGDRRAFAKAPIEVDIKCLELGLRRLGLRD